MPPPELWQERIDAIRAAGTVEAIADATVDRWLTPEFAAAHPEVRAELRAMLVASDVTGYTACAEAIQRMDLRPILPRIAAPTLVISGAEDPSTPPEHQRLIAEAIPGARLETLSPAAHVAAVERPDAVNALIDAHLH
jgi:3-oxoadipate enol-lactonase